MVKHKPVRAKTAPLPTSTEKLHAAMAEAVDAAVGVIAIRTPLTEVFKVQDAIYTFACDQHMAFRSHMMHTGWCTYEMLDAAQLREGKAQFEPLKPKSSDEAAAQSTKGIRALASDDPTNYPDEGYYVMLDVHQATMEEAGFQAAVRNQHHRSLTNEQRLFIIVPDYITIPDGLSPLLHIIDSDPPNRDELLAQFNDLMEQIEANARPSFNEDEINAILTTANGMTATAFDTAISIGITGHALEGNSAAGITFDEVLGSVRNYKTQMLRKTQMLELCAPVDMEDVGGLDLYKAWLDDRAGSFTEDAIAFGITPPRGVLCVGPSGTGKSLVAKATASRLKLPCIRLDIGKVFGSYIGQSEQHMRTVLKMIDEMSPCVLFVDEIDKGFAGMMGGGGGDNGTTMRVFGTFLTWMQERDQFSRPVFNVFTANRVANLPAELLRKGRLDEIWSVNMPNTVERRSILEIHLKKRKHKFSATDMANAVSLTDNLVGAEIEALIEGALNTDFNAGNESITFESFEAEHRTLRPLAVTFKEQMTAMATWAEQNARPASSAVSDDQVREAQGKAPRTAGKIVRRRLKARDVRA